MESFCLQWHFHPIARVLWSFPDLELRRKAQVKFGARWNGGSPSLAPPGGGLVAKEPISKRTDPSGVAPWIISRPSSTAPKCFDSSRFLQRCSSSPPSGAGEKQNYRFRGAHWRITKLGLPPVVKKKFEYAYGVAVHFSPNLSHGLLFY